MWTDLISAAEQHERTSRLHRHFARLLVGGARRLLRVGLDGDKRPIDSLTSNIGHLRQFGIVLDERSGPRRRSPPLRPALLGLGRPHPLPRRPRLQPDRLPRWHDLGLYYNSILALGLARTGFRDAANRIALAQLEARVIHRPPPPRGIRRLRALDQPLSSALPDRVQPPGLGNRYALRLHSDDARPRGPRRRAAAARPSRAGGDRQHRHPRLAALGHDWDIEVTGRSGKIKRAS